MLGCYESAAAWLALAAWHQEQGAEAARRGLALLRWALAHPETPAELSVHEVRRLAATGSASCAR